MTKNNLWKISVGIVAIIVIVFAVIKISHKPSKDITREVRPFTGNIQTVITSTATVQPQNRLEIKPPINGRIDSILVKEGQEVKAGETLAWMSSTERAALLDAARARGPEAMKYWEEVYKPTPLISPIDGEVIVSQDEPGQIVTSADAVLVLSDRLIVQAQVDETDIGAVRIGQAVLISLDAYPQIKVNGTVDHIYYESTTVNNVTIYKVDIVPDAVPDVFRSGMTATVTITERSKDGVLLLPLDVVKRANGGTYVYVKTAPGKKPVERKVELGMSDEKNVEVVSGISDGDIIVGVSQKYTLPTGPKTGSNPFMPNPRKK